MQQQHDHHAAPLDPAAAAALRERGFRYALVDTSDEGALDAWGRAVARGFHGPAPEDDGAEHRRSFARQQRVTGVWPADDSAAGEPVATASSWIAELTVPGPRAVPAWAISSITVSQTHAGLGLARALLEGELRTAAALGVPVAALTVSESTIYGRYGFGIATEATDFEIDTRRVRWSGPDARGDLAFIGAAEAAVSLREVHDRSRRSRPGEFSTLEGFWERVTGAYKPNDADTRARRFVRYRDAAGELAGVVVYRLAEDAEDFTQHTLSVEYLAALHDEASAALWRFLLQTPLVATVKAPLRALDEPVRWMLGDYRAATATTNDHQWVRVLDVPAALASRAYAGPGSIALDIADPLGFAAGAVRLDVDAGGTATVTPLDAGVDADIALDIASLGSLLLGGVSADVLAAAGRLGRAGPSAIAVVDRLFRTPRAPWLSTWY